MKLKQNLKVLLGHFLSPIDKAIFVNSYGRSGSTMVSQSIIQSSIKQKNSIFNTILVKALSQQAWDIDNTQIRPGFVYKTHDYPPKKDLFCNVRVIYIFADPVDVVLSLIRLYNDWGEEWMKEHYKHLKAPYSDFNNIIFKDQLKLENHFEAWLNEIRFPVAFFKYEHLWNHERELSEFLGMTIQLPPYKTRISKKNPDHDVLETINNTYLSFRERILNCESFFINNV